MSRLFPIILLVSLLPMAALASIFGAVRMIVHDPEHRPLQGAEVVLRSASSAWSRTTTSDSTGVAEFGAVPSGDYEATISAKGFSAEKMKLTVISGRLLESHAQLLMATVAEDVTVTGALETIDPTSSTPEGMVDKVEIARTPGADRANSLNFITDFVPGAAVVHDQLHVRGGHQVTWAMDGVPLPNTNIASNVGPQFDPKDAAYIEQQRGAYSAEYGDRTYGVFNVVPRSGFERDRRAELVAGYGSFNQSDDQLSFGDHSERSAYYVSLAGNRSGYGLETPTSARLHDAASGGSAFTSLQTNLDARDQLRFTGGFRGDFYQVPNDAAAESGGVRDREREQDGFAVLTYAHTLNARSLLTISPFYHFNRAAFEGGRNDVPVATDNRVSTYLGGQMIFSATPGRNNFKAGLYTFAQRDDHRFSIVANDGSGMALRERTHPDAALGSLFIEDQYRPLDWLTFNLGLRATRFSGEIEESAADPRLGMAIRIPRLGWVLRAAYSRFYQAPPLVTVSGPLLQFALARGFGFLPLKGEQDEQHDLGITIPIKRWAIDVDNFRTGARNFFDHDVLANSNIFFPLSIDRVRTRGTEVTVRSPHIFHRLTAHLAYSDQSAKGQGAVSGGLTTFAPTRNGFFYLDHNQRHTLSSGITAKLPRKSWFSGNVNYGSGFLNRDGPAHLPSYYTLDVSVGTPLCEKIDLKVSATNVTGQQYFIDMSNTFGGSHFSDPRQVSVQLRYKFRY